MPTKTIILLSAMMGFVLLIVIGIIITVIATGNFLAKKNEEVRPNSNYLQYVKNVDKYKCPKCGGDLKLYLGKDNRTYYRCKDEKCDYMVDPEELLNKKSA